LYFNCTHAAKFIGVKSPIPYRWWRVIDGDKDKYLKYGMNFAHGGTGVFKTLVSDPNMTVQIDFFQQLIKDNLFNATDLESSVALVTLSGNDYSAYIARNGTTEVSTINAYTYIHNAIDYLNLLI
jgi:hypothetical protein